MAGAGPPPGPRMQCRSPGAIASNTQCAAPYQNQNQAPYSTHTGPRPPTVNQNQNQGYNPTHKFSASVAGHQGRPAQNYANPRPAVPGTNGRVTPPAPANQNTLPQPLAQKTHQVGSNKNPLLLSHVAEKRPLHPPLSNPYVPPLSHSGKFEKDWVLIPTPLSRGRAALVDDEYPCDVELSGYVLLEDERSHG